MTTCSEDYLSFAWDSADDGMAIINSNGKIFKINCSWTNFFADHFNNNVSPVIGDEFFTSFPIDLFNETHPDEMFDSVRMMLRGQQLCFRMSYTFHSFGRARHCLLRAKPIAGTEGFALVSITDITSQITVQQDAAMALRKSDEAARAKSEFLANINHELRTPLNGIIGMIQALKMTTLDSEQTTYMNLALKASSRLTAILSEIVDTIKIDTGLISIKHDLFTIDEIVNNIKMLYCANCQISNIDLVVLSPTANNRVYIGDKIKIQKIINNLVGNAFKFTSKGTITLEFYSTDVVGSDEAILSFSVSDTGVGISDNVLQSVTEPFVQGDGHMNKQAEGIGLGLYAVKQTLAILNGTLTIDSKVGIGTTVHVVIPIKTQAHVEVPAGVGLRPIPDQASPVQLASILLAEDDEINQIATKKLLEKSGYVVTVACNGEEALSLLAVHDFDLILMDIQMPVMDGLAAVTAIQTEPRFASKRSIPIIALTAYSSNEDHDRLIDAGISEHIPKPVEINVLKETIHRMISITQPR